MTQNGVPQTVTIDDAEAAGPAGIGTGITWILPSTSTGEQAATYSVTISGILDANQQPLPDISYTTTTFVPAPTTATLTSQVQFLAPTNQTAVGSATSTVTLREASTSLRRSRWSSRETEFPGRLTSPRARLMPPPSWRPDHSP